MTHPVPAAVPATLRAGDTATWTSNPAHYAPSDGWAMDYIMVTAGAQIALSASVVGNEFLVEVAPATTALWTAGNYAWQERVSKGGQIFTTATGSHDDEHGPPGPVREIPAGERSGPQVPRA